MHLWKEMNWRADGLNYEGCWVMKKWLEWPDTRTNSNNTNQKWAILGKYSPKGAPPYKESKGSDLKIVKALTYRQFQIEMLSWFCAHEMHESEERNSNASEKWLCDLKEKCMFVKFREGERCMKKKVLSRPGSFATWRQTIQSHQCVQ